MNANRNGHTLLAPDEGEVLEAGANRVVVKVASPSQLVCEYMPRPTSPGPRCTFIPGSTRPSSSSRVNWR